MLISDIKYFIVILIIYFYSYGFPISMSKLGGLKHKFYSDSVLCTFQVNVAGSRCWEIVTQDKTNIPNALVTPSQKSFFLFHYTLLERYITWLGENASNLLFRQRFSMHLIHKWGKYYFFRSVFWSIGYERFMNQINEA